MNPSKIKRTHRLTAIQRLFQGVMKILLSLTGLPRRASYELHHKRAGRQHAGIRLKRIQERTLMAANMGQQHFYRAVGRQRRVAGADP
jgi:hypothetical protein